MSVCVCVEYSIDEEFQWKRSWDVDLDMDTLHPWQHSSFHEVMAAIRTTFAEQQRKSQKTAGQKEKKARPMYKQLTVNWFVLTLMNICRNFSLHLQLKKLKNNSNFCQRTDTQWYKVLYTKRMSARAH